MALILIIGVWSVILLVIALMVDLPGVLYFAAILGWLGAALFVTKLVHAVHRGGLAKRDRLPAAYPFAMRWSDYDA
jgi:hypothetical protein